MEIYYEYNLQKLNITKVTNNIIYDLLYVNLLYLN